MFAVDDIDETRTRLREHGAELVSSEVIQYEDMYRLCYSCGPEGLAEASPKNSAERQAFSPRDLIDFQHSRPTDP
jgi:hypothetical protein